MKDWRHILTWLADQFDDQIDRLKYRLENKIEGPGGLLILPYRSYGTPTRLHLLGRVLRDKHITPDDTDDTVWRNLLNMYRRLQSDEVPFARLLIHNQGQEQEIVTDKEGYFEIDLPLDPPLAPEIRWQSVPLELCAAEDPVRANARVFIPSPQADFGVISDIDDTVVWTDAVNLLHMARNVFLGNAHSRTPFPGVAAFYRALFTGPHTNAQNPIFYVSSSPWNLYDLLSEFFRLNDFPPEPLLFLRDWGVSDVEILPTDHLRHKTGVIQKMLATYPHLPFILIGDSGQKDPEVYNQILTESPHRIQAIYIRDVSRTPARTAEIEKLAEKAARAGVDLILAPDTLALAHHAADRGWIDSAALPAIAETKAKDTAATPSLEEAGRETTA